jgi:DNA-binding response OmpR family regulator
MGTPRKILVVDDDFEIVEFVKAVLKTKGYHILTAYDGEEGWNLLLREKPDLAVIDLRMPGISGLEFCKRVRRTPEVAQMPLLVISSLTVGTDKPDQFWAMGLGSDDFLAKPFDPLSLLGRVEYLLRKSEYLSDTREMTRFKESQGAEVKRERRSLHEEDDPAEIVRLFVESWNTQDFSTEYDTLADEMLGGVSREEYIQRRKQLFADMDGSGVEQNVLDTDVRITHNMATVACLREDVVKGAKRPKDERYTLRKTPRGWKIMSVRSRPISFMVD